MRNQLAQQGQPQKNTPPNIANEAIFPASAYDNLQQRLVVFKQHNQFQLTQLKMLNWGGQIPKSNGVGAQPPHSQESITMHAHIGD